mmetsp:Transcript_2241/g.8126  ORF Transcript_2241/g.8126 Transcript_2241/m.8126 type:complete len:229 (+) Transcript_2241:2146-2832(+)
MVKDDTVGRGHLVDVHQEGVDVREQEDTRRRVSGHPRPERLELRHRPVGSALVEQHDVLAEGEEEGARRELEPHVPGELVAHLAEARVLEAQQHLEDAVAIDFVHELLDRFGDDVAVPSQRSPAQALREAEVLGRGDNLPAPYGAKEDDGVEDALDARLAAGERPKPSVRPRRNHLPLLLLEEQQGRQRRLRSLQFGVFLWTEEKHLKLRGAVLPCRKLPRRCVPCVR